MNDLRIKYTKPTIVDVTHVDTDVVLVQLSGTFGPGGPRPTSVDEDENKNANGEGFEYNPFQ